MFARYLPRPQSLLLVCLTIIISVSVYDTWLVHVYRDHIHTEERNPVCLMLIKFAPDSLSWFFAGKAIGNLAVAAVLAGLYWIGYRFWQVIAISVAAFQCLLTIYLNFSDPKTGFLNIDALIYRRGNVSELAWQSFTVHLVPLIATVVVLGYAFVLVRSAQQPWRQAESATTRVLSDK